ncbi:MAG: DUF29 domain-containing protein [Microcystaceae cyanobacterium]
MLKDNLISLYELNYDHWLEKTIYLLQENKFNELDKQHLIEELEALSRRDKRAVERLLEQIIGHLLLLQYWTTESDYNANHWQAEIISFRTQLNEDLTQNLRNHLQENKTRIYVKGLRYVRQKTGYQVTFPEDCPYTLEQILDLDWLPLASLDSDINQQ